MEIAASTVVSFGSDADSSALVVFELDPVLNVDVDGNEITSFGPGDDVFMRLHHDSSVELARIAATDGHVAGYGSGARDVEQLLSWVDVDAENDLDHIPLSAIAATFYGNEATGLRRIGKTDLVVSGGVFPALSLLQYTAEYQLFRLIAPVVELEDGETYPVEVVAYMEAAA